MPRGKARAATSAGTYQRRLTGGRPVSRVRAGWRVLRTAGYYQPGLILITLRPWWADCKPGVMVGYAWYQARRAKSIGSTALRRAGGPGITFIGVRSSMRPRGRLGMAWRGNLVLWMRVH
jgi:hypothetical protein